MIWLLVPGGVDLHVLYGADTTSRPFYNREQIYAE